MSEHQAWNNFVMGAGPSVHPLGSDRRAAAMANLFCNLSNNGGLNSFLTSTYDFDPNEVVECLLSIGAPMAAKQLGRVLRGLGCRLVVSSQDERWQILDRCWKEELDEFDVLTEEADRELTRALERHVSLHEKFYIALDDVGLPTASDF